MADTPKRSTDEIRLLRGYVNRHGATWRDRLAHDIAGDAAPQSLAQLYRREKGHLQPLPVPDKQADDDEARIARYGDLVCALVVILGESIVLQVPTTASDQVRRILADLEETGILRGGRTGNTGLRPFHAKMTASCRKRAAPLLR